MGTGSAANHVCNNRCWGLEGSDLFLASHKSPNTTAMRYDNTARLECCTRVRVEYLNLYLVEYARRFRMVVVKWGSWPKKRLKDLGVSKPVQSTSKKLLRPFTYSSTFCPFRNCWLMSAPVVKVVLCQNSSISWLFQELGNRILRVVRQLGIRRWH